MNYYQELKKYLNNNLFTSYSLEIDFPKIYNFNANQKAFRDILTKITKIYDKNKFIKQNEHQFEDEFISKVLEILGYVAKEKFPNVEFIKAGAQNLPLESQSLDILSISYGIRNVVERQKALSEFARVLQKDGILVVLEFTKREKGGFIAACRDFYLKNILPSIGGIISKNKSAYEYLPNSIEGFLSKKEFILELKNAGFEMLDYKSFSFGVSSMFIAKKL